MDNTGPTHEDSTLQRLQLCQNGAKVTEADRALLGTDDGQPCLKYLLVDVSRLLGTDLPDAAAAATTSATSSAARATGTGQLVVSAATGHGENPSEPSAGDAGGACEEEPPERRKAPGHTVSEWAPRTFRAKSQQLADNVLGSCATQEDAAKLLSAVLQRVERAYPGVMSEVLRETDKDCHCSPLVANVKEMREAWKSVNMPVARALDGVVFKSGFTNKKLISMGYLTAGQLRQRLKMSVKKWHMKKVQGRPSKVKDPRWQGLVKDALDFFSTASSWTCVGFQKER